MRKILASLFLIAIATNVSGVDITGQYFTPGQTNDFTVIQNFSSAGISFDDGDSKIYEASEDEFTLYFNGNSIWKISADVLGAVNAHGAKFRNTTASSSNPTIVPDSSDYNTGIGWNASKDLSMVSNGAESGRFDDDSTARNTRFMLYDVDNGKLERVSVGDADSGGSGYKVLRIPN